MARPRHHAASDATLGAVLNAAPVAQPASRGEEAWQRYRAQRGADRLLFAVLLILAAAVFFCANFAHADDYSLAVQAYSRGDFAAAYRQYLAQAEKGDIRAQGAVACMLQHGEGVSRDPAQALPWLLKAAQGGLEPAQVALARAYENGLGTSPDPAQALIWYGKAAEKGNPSAREDVQRLQAATTVSKDSGASPVRQDPAPVQPAPAPVQPAAAPVQPATAPVEPAAEPASQGGAPADQAAAPIGQPAAPAAASAEAQSMPELRFESQLAKKMRAAEAGDVEAQLFVGYSYSTGKDTGQDKAEAAKWYRKAAEAGNKRAQMALGWLYFSGEVGRKDLAEAAKWYRKAAAQGDARAKKLARQIGAALRKQVAEVR